MHKLQYHVQQDTRGINMVDLHRFNSRIIRWPELHNKVGYCRTNIYYLIQSGEFPAPIKLGARAVGWLESDIEEWIASRVKASRSQEAAS